MYVFTIFIERAGRIDDPINGGSGEAVLQKDGSPPRHAGRPARIDDAMQLKNVAVGGGDIMNLGNEAARGDQLDLVIDWRRRAAIIAEKKRKRGEKKGFNAKVSLVCDGERSRQ